jgi:beta-N-acetylhexosaminidase
LALRRKIGGLLVVGFRGLTIAESDPVARAIVEDGLGGVILFSRDQLTGASRNIASPTQLADLTGHLRELAGGRPLFISVDQEGGVVARLTPANGFPATVSEASIGAADNVANALAIGRATAQTLKSAGIDWNLAPVVDLNVNPSNPSIGALGRSFSADAGVVVAMAAAIVQAHREQGILTALKHFPGLGSATGDTDRGFVDVTKTWHATELEPFRRLASDNHADCVMVANSFNGQIDATYPATLSVKTVQGRLRGDIGWDRLVVTDDLQAGAIRSAYSDAKAVELAMAAGCDVLLFANQQVYVPDVANRVIDTVVALVAAGTIAEAAIDTSLARIAAARASVGA